MSEETTIRREEPRVPLHTAKFRLTPAAYTQLNYIVQRRSRKKRRLATLALAAVLTILYAVMAGKPLSTLILLLVVEMLVLWPVSVLGDKAFLGVYARRSQRLSPAALDEQIFEFYDDGFRIVNPKTESFVEYGKIVSMARTDDYLALFITEVYAYLILGDAADCGMAGLTEFLQQKLGGMPLENYRTH